VVLARLDLLGHEREATVREATEVFLDGSAISPENVELHDVDVLEAGREQLAARVVVECDLVAACAMILESSDQSLVDQLILEQLQHDPPAGQRLGVALEKEVARHVDPRAALTDDGVEAELRQRVDHDGRGGLVVIRDDGRVLVRAAEQQLISDDLEPEIEDRLTRYEDLRH
jgi:hypothetical protein